MSAAHALPAPEAPEAPRPFTSTEIVRHLKVTRRQLQWWDEHLIVVPLIVGKTRWYSHAQLVQIAVLAELRRKGMTIRDAKKFLKPVQGSLERKEHPEFLVICDWSGSRIDARKGLYILGDRATAAEAASTAARAAYVVALSPIYDAIAGIRK